MIKYSYSFVIFLLVAQTLQLCAADKLVFRNGDVVSGKYLGQTESLVYFESEYFGTLRVPINAVELQLESAEEINDTVASQDTPSSPSAPQPESETKPKGTTVVATPGNTGAKSSGPNPEKKSDTPTSTQPSSSGPPEALPAPIVVTNEAPSYGLGVLWESTEKTLNRFVHDRVPSWFPSLPEDWKGEIKLGLNINEAIKTSERYNGQFKIEGDKPRTNYLFRSYLSYAKTDDVRSEHDWGVSGRFRYKLRKTDFFETYASHDVDELHDPEFRSTGSVGFGIKPYNSNRFKLDTVFGGAVSRIERRDSDAENTFQLNFNENLKWKFNKHMSLNQSLRLYVAPDEDLEYNYRFESGLNTLIIGAFNLGFSYRLDYDSTIKNKDARKKSRIITSLGVKF